MVSLGWTVLFHLNITVAQMTEVVDASSDRHKNLIVFGSRWGMITKLVVLTLFVNCTQPQCLDLTVF